MKVFLKLLLLLASFSLLSINTFSQQVILKPDSYVNKWFDLEEWIYSNANLAFSSYDIFNKNSFNEGFSNELENRVILYVNDVLFSTSWLMHENTVFPNFALSEIDSIVISNNRWEMDLFNANLSIQIFTKTKNNLGFELGRINQINDPGLNRGNIVSENVEAINYHETISTIFSFKNLRSSFYYNNYRFSRTNQIIYDRAFNRNLFLRSANPDIEILQRNSLINYIWYNTLTLNNSRLSFLLAASRSPSIIQWNKLSGIDVPFQLDRFQISSSYTTPKNSIYKGSSINVSVSDSDTLNYTPKSFYGLKEINAFHSSDFSFISGKKLFNVTLSNHHYYVEDYETMNSYSFTESKLSSSIQFTGDFSLFGSISNTSNSFLLKRDLDNYSLEIGFKRNDISKNRYNFTFWNRGIGFSNLDPNTHSINLDSDFIKSFYEIRLSKSSAINNQAIQGLISFKHYTKFVNEEVHYFTIPNSLQLGTQLNYFDSKGVGIIGFNLHHTIEATKKLHFKTMLGGNVDLYGNKAFRAYYKSVPSYVFSEIIQYKVHENFVTELFFRYIPVRRIVEYENLERETGFPPSRVRPIPLLNFSSSMWFFDRRLEGKLTLRNLLNKAESYDTNGQYYYMSINVSARINFDL